VISSDLREKMLTDFGFWRISLRLEGWVLHTQKSIVKSTHKKAAIGLPIVEKQAPLCS
jgi:hypothetical protein